jgi:N-acyl-D-aspartate/D-glutamate deacylase
MSAEYDLVLRNGLIVDGTGREPAEGDVAVKDGRIVATGQVSGRGAEEISARDKIITPGFVDIHTHYDGQVTWENQIKPSSSHGVTTAVFGNCGVGFAPCKPGERELLIRLMEGVEDIPHPVLVEGLPWTWESYPEYLDVVGARQFDINVGSYVPHSCLRVFVMGERALNLEPATASDREQMAALFKEALRAGALGIGTSRTVFHRSSDGKPIPTLEAEEVELQAFADVLSQMGAGVFQIVAQLKDPAADMALVRRLAERSGRPVTFSMGEGLTPETSGQWRTMLEEVRKANEAGLTIRPQVLGRAIGMLLGHQMTLNPFSTRPSYEALGSLSFAEKIAALHDPQVRANILAETPDKNPKSEFVTLVRRFETMYEMGQEPDYEPLPENSLAARAARQGITPDELAYDLMLGRDGTAMLYLAQVNYASGNLNSTYEMLQHPDTVFGLGDGGAHCATICDASYSTFALKHWGRDRSRGPRLPLQSLVKRMTKDTAETVGLLDRGVVAPGYRADLNVIDLDGLDLYAPELIYDLPSGGKRLHQRAKGYAATIVGGTAVARDDQPTGALPGRLVRGGQAAPVKA